MDPPTVGTHQQKKLETHKSHKRKSAFGAPKVLRGAATCGKVQGAKNIQKNRWILVFPKLKPSMYDIWFMYNLTHRIHVYLNVYIYKYIIYFLDIYTHII